MGMLLIMSMLQSEVYAPTLGPEALPNEFYNFPSGESIGCLFILESYIALVPTTLAR